MTIKTDFDTQVAAATSDDELNAIVDAAIAQVSRCFDRAQIAAALLNAALTTADRRAIGRAFGIGMGEA
jgi:hypothetical protein